MTEVCIHQLPEHPLWENCKTCAYDPQNNKICTGYFSINITCQYKLSGPPNNTTLKEEWEKCKACKYPINNKDCKTRSPIEISVKKPEQTSIKQPVRKLEEIVPELLELNSSTLPVSQN